MNNLTKFVLLVTILVTGMAVASNVDAQSVKERVKGLIVEADADIGGTLTVDGIAITPFVVGSDVITTVTTIDHSLGVVPGSVLVTPLWAGTNITQTVFVTNATASTFDVYLTDGEQTGAAVNWLAAE